MAYLFLAIFTILGAWNILKGKNALTLVVIYYFITPNIPIGNGLVVDSSYVFIFILFVIYVVFHNGKIAVTKHLNSFVMLTFLWIITYTLGWYVGGNKAPQTYLISVLGLIKTLAAVILCMCLSHKMTKEEMRFYLGKGLAWVIGLNAVAVGLQYLFPYQMYDICYKLYYSASSSGYTSYEQIESWGSGFYNGRYYRYFGLNETPMVLSCIVIFVLVFVLIQYSSDKRFFLHPRILTIVALFVGVSAQCKIFFLMIPVLILLYVYSNSKRLSHGKVLVYVIGCVGCLFLLIYLDEISSITTFRYLQYLADPLEAFATRFGNGSETAGYLTETIKVSLDYLLTGVGPVSISGEPIADSSYVVIVHNGGMIAGLAMAVFYVEAIRKNYIYNAKINNVLVYSMLIMGLSRTNLLYGNMLILMLFYLYADLGVRKSSLKSTEHLQKKIVKRISY